MILWFYEDFGNVSVYGRTRWRRYLKHCATRRMVAGSIPDGFTGIFHWLNPSDRTMALESAQLLTKMSTRSTSWDCKCGRCLGHTDYLDVRKSGSLSLLSRPVCCGMWCDDIQPTVRKEKNICNQCAKINLMYCICCLDNLTDSRQM